MSEDIQAQPLSEILEKNLLSSRNLFLSGAVDGAQAKKLQAELLTLEQQDRSSPIVLWINSPGGEVHSGFAIYDMIQFIQPKVITVVSGSAASMGSLIALAAEKEDRYATMNAKFLLHQPLIGGTIQGPASDIEIHAKDIIKLKQKIIQMYADRTGHSKEYFEKVMERDHWLSAEEALEIGLVSRIVKKGFHP
jgi:ATP-dependent Clp protease, protease subunit